MLRKYVSDFMCLPYEGMHTILHRGFRTGTGRQRDRSRSGSQDPVSDDV